MGWLHKVLHGEAEGGSETESVAAVPNPEHLVPPALPKLGGQDPAAAHKRQYATKVCPSCQAKQHELPHETVSCESCGEPIVVKAGEDGRWHLLREADLTDFAAQQEQIRSDRFKTDEETLLEAGFLTGDVQVDVGEESDHQEGLERIAGELSSAGSIEPVVALLTREPGHANDKNAIRIDVGDATVGYIQKSSARQVQPLMQRLEKAGRPAWVRGWVVGGWEDDRSGNNYRFRLDSLPKVK
jgi:uncharacterized protein YidB (DUF937 family)